MPIEEFIRNKLSENPNGIKARVMARDSEFDRSEINSFLYSHPNDFYQNKETHEWFVKNDIPQVQPTKEPTKISKKADVAAIAKNESKRKKEELPKLTISEDDANELFERLCNWRTRISNEKHIPSYLIAKDETFKLISNHNLSKQSDLKEIKGIGEKNYKKYGKQIYEIYKSVYNNCNKNIRLKEATELNDIDDLSF